MKKLILLLVFILTLPNKAFSCLLLNVDIGSSVNDASKVFEFLEGYQEEMYGEQYSAKYTAPAIDYCEGSNLESSDVEVIIYKSKIVGINILSWDPEIKNEVFEFTNNFVGPLEVEMKKESWLGTKDMSIGSIIIVYSKFKLHGEIQESLEITKSEFFDYTLGELVLDAG